jgi:fused signal recognition particle receptor
MSFFDKIKLSRLTNGLAKTREALFGKVQKMIFGRSKIDDQLLDDLEEILLGADVGVTTTSIIIDNIRSRVKKERYEDARELDPLLRSEIQKLLEHEIQFNGTPFAVPENHVPHVIMIIGVNGVGKTTTIGKLAHNYRLAGNKVVIGAADTFRAAANEQLEIWAERAGVTIIKHLHGGDPAAVAFDALQSARAAKANVLIIDTAGRLHTKVHLMEELKKIRRVLQKISPDIPHETLLVLDASTGQNAIQQAKQFETAVGVTGLILTKLDGTAKGGVVLAINKELRLPVKYIGVGETIEDLQPFDKKAFVDALFETTQ